MELNAATEGPVRRDPCDPKFFADPYPIFRRLRTVQGDTMSGYPKLGMFGKAEVKAERLHS